MSKFIVPSRCSTFGQTNNYKTSSTNLCLDSSKVTFFPFQLVYRKKYQSEPWNIFLDEMKRRRLFYRNRKVELWKSSLPNSSANNSTTVKTEPPDKPAENSTVARLELRSPYWNKFCPILLPRVISRQKSAFVSWLIQTVLSVFTNARGSAYLMKSLLFVELAYKIVVCFFTAAWQWRTAMIFRLRWTMKKIRSIHPTKKKMEARLTRDTSSSDLMITFVLLCSIKKTNAIVKWVSNNKVSSWRTNLLSITWNDELFSFLWQK